MILKASRYRVKLRGSRRGEGEGEGVGKGVGLVESGWDCDKGRSRPWFQGVKGKGARLPRTKTA